MCAHVSVHALACAAAVLFMTAVVEFVRLFFQLCMAVAAVQCSLPSNLWTAAGIGLRSGFD
jgi:hypothetical protein